MLSKFFWFGIFDLKIIVQANDFQRTIWFYNPKGINDEVKQFGYFLPPPLQSPSSSVTLKWLFYLDNSVTKVTTPPPLHAWNNLTHSKTNVEYFQNIILNQIICPSLFCWFDFYQQISTMSKKKNRRKDTKEVGISWKKLFS